MQEVARKLPVPNTRDVPIAPSRFGAEPLAEIWRIGYGDAMHGIGFCREYKNPEEHRAYSVGYASGTSRLFQD